MTLDETVLRKLASWRPARGSRQTLAVPDEGSGWAVNLVVDRHDELGSAFWEVTLQRVAPTRREGSLEHWAKGVAERVTGLLEPLEILEIDNLRNEALVRSNRPTQRGAELFYYEILLKGTQTAQIRRYQGSPGVGRREQVSFVLTHEAFAKLAQDITAE
jgi:hypothetical protein